MTRPSVGERLSERRSGRLYAGPDVLAAVLHRPAVHLAEPGHEVQAQAPVSRIPMDGRGRLLDCGIDDVDEPTPAGGADADVYRRPSVSQAEIGRAHV